ncbi:SDR family NAD(P)-dependent oxidoreductase [Sodalis ligni]|uniref:NADP-dependent 3-hydroxy acid dehydrogenase YdfG n=1 Tax=Sodalis ligni TaxID=2697027 RepID=A0A4R1NAX4_9GAMM|nr:SDR family NAD(P)-dependent oxidoreductase [Sodalis ligni]TCL02741.1 NADP-dependent 3-hydroxy acid dehydrogenase YdfG [Sodalis ligni]
MSQVWFITGSAAGLGLSITEAALAAGNKVIASARKPERLAGLVATYGDRILPVELDVTDSAAAQRAVAAGIAAFGGIDVLVNNAGYGHMAPFEQTQEQAFRTEVETNFFGVVNVTRAVLPFMRERRAGYIFQVSSVGGRMGMPGMSAYQSAKWAVGGFSEVLAKEVSPLGIRVCCLEPGGMSTNWGERALQDVPPIMPEYESSVGALLGFLKQYLDHENGDPAKVAQVILALAGHSVLPEHLLLGSDAVQYCAAAELTRQQEAERWIKVSNYIDKGQDIPLELP